jgi:hypothetical protein
MRIARKKNLRIQSSGHSRRPAAGFGRTFERARTLPGGRDKEVVTVRVLVVVLLGLVVVLAILTELCLLQAAAMRRKIRAVLPPEDQEGR